ncbi:recombinase family protein, partial [Citrobacter braakii]|uniref:recombinase family protein n=1 Tax=Citrobacter braakii TaxID=57706 RepID=UPI001982241C
MTGNAALYLRSSKDRHDVSIDAQRRELQHLAQSRQLTIVEEFADAVESGKDEDRPGFQALLRAIRAADRRWDTLLVLDTSRIARRRHIAIVFEEVECKRHGVRVVYKSLP